MAVSVNQGYVRSFNLSETQDESLAINNLAGGSISTDLKVFAGNTKNISRIIYKPGKTRFSIDTTFNTTRFTFDLLSCYGNGDLIKVKSAKIISDLQYNYTFDKLSVTFSSPHGLNSSTDIGAAVRLLDTYYDGIGTLFFNEKDFKISEIPTTTSIILNNIGWAELFQEGPGTYDPTADLPIGTTERYPIALCQSFSLPNPLSYSQQYYVVLTNGINQFKVATSYQRGILPDPILLTESVSDPLIFERSNEVTQQNILNLVVPEFSDGGNDGGGFIYSNGVLNRNFNNNFEFLEGTLDSSNYFRLKKYTTSRSNLFAVNPIKLEGNLRTFDPDEFNSGTEEIFAETSPGIFILDPNSTSDNVEKLRSFSDNTSPWDISADATTLEYSAASISDSTQQEMSIGNLILRSDGIEPISLNEIQQISQPPSGSNISPAQKFKYKLPVIINGEEYNLLMAESIT